MQVESPQREKLTETQELILSAGCACCGARLLERIDVVWGPVPGSRIVKHWRGAFALCCDCANRCLGSVT